jgi:hypothetical protein
MHSEKGMQRQKISEEKMAKYLTSVGIDYSREHYCDHRCTEIQEDKWSMLDFLMIMFGVIIIVENDEEQHRSYMTVCEVKRIAEIVESWAVGGNTLPIVFIRYNPHGFTVNGVEQKVSQEKRLEKLFEILNDESHEIQRREASEDHAHVLRHGRQSPGCRQRLWTST